MSDTPVRTQIETPDGTLPFQHYLVKHRAGPAVRAIHFEGARDARPAAGVTEAIAEANGIVICPSNPLISLGPILAVPGIREALAARRDDVVVVSPIVGGLSLKGPSDKMMKELGYEVSAAGVAKIYRDIAARIVIDERDADLRREIEDLGIAVTVTNTIMQSDEDKTRLAEHVVNLFREKTVQARA
jgi:LPPG:FO 2-phospho-L-lactate transferase